MLAGAVLLFVFAFVLVLVLDGGNIMLITCIHMIDITYLKLLPVGTWDIKSVVIMFVCGCIGVGWREGR